MHPVMTASRFVAALLILAALPTVSCAQEGDEPAAAAPTNVILFIADGMGVSSLATVSSILEQEGARLVIETLPVTGLLRTNALEGVVTESASSATSLATGYKTVRRRVSMTADSLRARTLIEAARDAGLATGILTTTSLVDATPAAFGTHALIRYDREHIADQFLASGIDVLMGGDPGVFTPVRQAEARKRGYTVVKTEGMLRDVEAGRVLGLFGEERAPDTGAFGPPMALTTEKAIDLLAGHDGGFFLVAEQEETDTGAHENDLERVVAGIQELDAAVSIALDFARRRGDTLVLVTADHDTGGFSDTEGDGGVLWLTGRHTNQYVPILAFGPGAERFTGVYENTDVPVRLAELLGLAEFPALLDAAPQGEAEGPGR